MLSAKLVIADRASSIVCRRSAVSHATGPFFDWKSLSTFLTCSITSRALEVISSACAATLMARRYSVSSVRNLPSVPSPFRSASEISAALTLIRAPADVMILISSWTAAIRPFALFTVCVIAARPAWRQDLDHGTGLCTGHANDRAGLQAGNTGELRVQRELRRERHPAVADHEQSDREEQQAGDHENTNAGRARGARQLPASLRAHERLHQRLAVAIQLARGSPRHRAAVAQHRPLA